MTLIGKLSYINSRCVRCIYIPTIFTYGDYTMKHISECIKDYMMNKDELKKFVKDMANRQVPDEDREGIDLYYDLDDIDALFHAPIYHV